MKRLESLDALRGIAALVVLLYHLSLVYDVVNYLLVRTYLLRLVVAGQAAVSIFFVLSGFVLFHALRQTDHFRYLPYVVRRLLRLYPPLLAAVFVGAGLYLVSDHDPVAALSAWFNTRSWSSPLSWTLLLGHIALLDPDRFHTLDNVMWSLVHEIRISILFPVLALGVKRVPRTTLIASALVAGVSSKLALPVGSMWFLNPFLTLQYLFLFAAGAYMAARQDDARAFMAERSPTPFLLAAAILLSVAPATALGVPVTIGAIILVLLSFASEPVVRCLSWRPFVWLGRVSYSLYLTHVPILLATIHGLHGLVPPWSVLPFLLPVSLLAAELFFRVVERPSIRLSRWSATRLNHA